MRIESLEAFGIDENILKLWKEVGHGELLPVQEKAIRKCGVLAGKSVLVFSPTSSGKTFVGEMAAVKTARQNRRVIYLVPQKALAEEKYNEFRSRYREFGVRVVISTRDRREFDHDISRGEFHIAIVVFEKMQGLLVTCPALLRKVGIVVIDELQMIGDEERGAGLEILLTKMKLSDGRPQIIGLSAVLRNARHLADWLGAGLCSSSKRPIELRKGVLWNGEFHYVEHNSGERGSENLAAPEDGSDASMVMIGQVRDFVERGEQCLVFCRSKRESIRTAARIAAAIEGKRAGGALTELSDLEDSRGKEILTRLLEHGVAYHNADLGWDQRDVIERWFRRNEIAVICATTTLAMGVNLPAKNVFVDPERWERDKAGHWITLPIPQAEYENSAGRAGRLGLAEDFGRAILTTDSQFDARTYYSVYVKGRLGDVQPALNNNPLAHHVLNLVASGICKSETEIRDVLLSSYTGETFWRGGERETEFNGRLCEAVEYCLDGELIEGKNGALAPTRLGRLAAVKGVSVATAVELARFAREHKADALELHLIEILLCLTRTKDGQTVYFNLSTQEFNSREYATRIKALLETLPSGVRERVAAVEDFSMLGYEEVKRLKKTLLLYEWAEAVPTRQIEEGFQSFAGGIAGMATEHAWLAETLAAITDVYEWPEVAVRRLKALSEQLIHGVSEHAVGLVAASVRGLGRGRVKNLLDAGLDTLENVLAAPRDQLDALVTKPVAGRLLRRVKQILIRNRARFEADGDAPDAEATVLQQEFDWSSQVPPSDDAGLAYQSAVQITLDGRPKDRRHLVRVGTRHVWLRERSFEVLLKLAAAALATDLGWVPGVKLGEPGTYHQVIRRLKVDLKAGGADVNSLIENSGSKQYRLSVPPSNIAIDSEMIRKHLPEHVRLLSRLDASRRRSA